MNYVEIGFFLGITLSNFHLRPRRPRQQTYPSHVDYVLVDFPRVYAATK